MELKFNSEQFGELVGAAVMAQISGENRDAILKEAICELLTPQSGGGYSKASSPMQRAFNQAVEQYARKFVADQLESNTDMSQQLHSVVIEAVSRVFNNPESRESLVGKISTAIADSFGYRY
jgi:hypothetical protein